MKGPATKRWLARDSSTRDPVQSVRIEPWLLMSPSLALLLVFLVVPLMSSVVVRSYGWMVLLAPQGLVNTALLALGIVDEPLALLYTPTGTAIALSAVLLPFMVIILTPVIQSVEEDLELAAQS